jgi:hypothetical protein
LDAPTVIRREHPAGSCGREQPPGERSADRACLAARQVTAGAADPRVGSPEHAAENVAAASIELTSSEEKAISNAAV